jgi:succinate-acetate transporter protein
MARSDHHKCLHREFLLQYAPVNIILKKRANSFQVAGIGMVISAQWELVLGNSFGYTALSAFGELPHPFVPPISH